MNQSKLLSWVLVFVLAFGFSMDADAQSKKEKRKKKKKKGQVEQVVAAPLQSRIIDSDRSTVCDVFTFTDGEPTDEDLARISQTFAYMNLRRKVKDYGPDEYSAYYYWNQMYEEAPGFSILVYTDGSAIFREMAAVAKENGEEELYEEYADKALALLEEGEKCYPETKGKFNPAKAYIYELLYPTDYGKIFDLYTNDLGPTTDPYSLMSITRYGLYMGWIGEITREEGIEWKDKTKAIAAAQSDDSDYEYALEVIDLTWEDYKPLYQEAEDRENPKVVEQTQTTTSETATAQVTTSAGTIAYNDMVAAFDSENYSVANTKFNEYLATETDTQRAYDVSVYAASSFEAAQDYPKARNAYRKAANLNPSQGMPYYRIGMMYLGSGPICGPGTGFDSQRVIWAAFDKLRLAKTKTLDAASSADIDAQIAGYKEYLPANWQLDEKGLSNGDTYTVPCWINETVTVVSKEAF